MGYWIILWVDSPNPEDMVQSLLWETDDNAQQESLSRLAQLEMSDPDKQFSLQYIFIPR